MLALVIRLGWNRRVLALSAVALAAYTVSLAPWYYRNYAHYNVLIFTSIANQNLLIYNVGSIEARRQGISWDEAKDRLWLEYQSRLDDLDVANPNQAQISAIMGEIAVWHILADPASALLYQTADLLNAFRPGYSMAMLLLRDSAEAFGREVQVGNLEVIADAAAHEYVVFGLMTVYYAVVYLGVIMGGAILIWRRQWYTLVICGLISFWFIYQPGIAGNARFRAPIEGLLALLAAVGLLWIRAQVARLRPGDRVQRIT
jgi:hypothetical protein